MSSDELQWIFAGIAVAVAFAFVFKKYFPNTVYNWRQKTAIALLRDHPAGFRRWLGNRIAVRKQGDSDDHCDGCNGCD